MSRLDPLELANAALRLPHDFAYYGDLHERDGWGRAFGVHRDSDTLERSNWQVITRELRERFPAEFITEQYSHWLVGWVETGRIRVLHNPELGNEQNLTEAFHAVVEWWQRLDRYPIADERAHSELETQELRAHIEAQVPGSGARHVRPRTCPRISCNE